MKNTKELFIRLYTETLYSDFIVPLRGSNYIQLLYGGFQEIFGFLFLQRRRLVWQRQTNEIEQKLYGSWVIFEIDSLKQDLIETWLGLYQFTTKTLLKNVTKMSLKCHQKIKILNWGIEAKNCINLSTTFHRKKYHQMTTEIPPEIRADKCRLQAKIKAKNINTTYHYLILPNSSFMLCC